MTPAAILLGIVAAWRAAASALHRRRRRAAEREATDPGPPEMDFPRRDYRAGRR